MNKNETQIIYKNVVTKSQNKTIYKSKGISQKINSDIDELIFPDDEPRYVSER